MNDILAIVSSVVGVFVVMLLGGMCRRLGWLPRECDQVIAKIITHVLLPAYFISRIVGGPAFGFDASTWLPPTFGFALTGLGFGIGLAVARLIGPRLGLKNDSQQRAFALCVGICNYGYIPLPLAESFYPDAVTPLILHNVGVELALWSLGVAVVSGGAGQAWHRVLLSSPFLAVMIACSVKLVSGDATFPSMLSFAFDALGDCAIPLGLLLSGAIIVDFVADSSWMRSYAVPVSAVVVRQLLMPVLMFATVLLLPVGTTTMQVVLLQAAMPAAVFPIVLVRLYDRDTVVAIQVIVATSLAGLLLIPGWLLLGQMLLR